MVHRAAGSCPGCTFQTAEYLGVAELRSRLTCDIGTWKVHLSWGGFPVGWILPGSSGVLVWIQGKPAEPAGSPGTEAWICKKLLTEFFDVLTDASVTTQNSGFQSWVHTRSFW